MAAIGNAVRGALRLEGKVAVITGAARGIGEATARAFVSHGAKVVLTDVQDEEGEKLAQSLGGPDVARYLRCDVSSEEQVAAAVDMSVSAFGRLDVMYNNAGVLGPCGPIDEMPVQEVERAWAVLVKGPFLGLKHATRVMKGAGNGGSIITTSSVASHIAGAGPGVYTMCKHALLGMTRSAAYELRGLNIRVNNIAPGGTMTKIWHSAPGQVKEILRENMIKLAGFQSKGVTAAVTDPSAIANVAVFLASDESCFVSGHSLVADGSYFLNPDNGLGYFFEKHD